MELARQPQRDSALIHLGPPLSLDFTLLSPGEKAYLVLHIKIGTRKALSSFLSAIDAPMLGQLSFMHIGTNPRGAGPPQPQASDLGLDEFSYSVTIAYNSLIQGLVTSGDLMKYVYTPLDDPKGVPAAVRTLFADGPRKAPSSFPDVAAELVAEPGMEPWLQRRRLFLRSKSLPLSKL